MLCTLCVPSNVQKVNHYVCHHHEWHTHSCDMFNFFLHQVCYHMNIVFDMFIHSTLGVSSHDHCVPRLVQHLYTGCIMLSILTKSDDIPWTKYSFTEPCLHLFNKVFTFVHGVLWLTHTVLWVIHTDMCTKYFIHPNVFCGAFLHIIMNLCTCHTCAIMCDIHTCAIIYDICNHVWQTYAIMCDIHMMSCMTYTHVQSCVTYALMCDICTHVWRTCAINQSCTSCSEAWLFYIHHLHLAASCGQPSLAECVEPHGSH